MNPVKVKIEFTAAGKVYCTEREATQTELEALGIDTDERAFWLLTKAAASKLHKFLKEKP